MLDVSPDHGGRCNKLQDHWLELELSFPFYWLKMSLRPRVASTLRIEGRILFSGPISLWSHLESLH